MKACPIIAVSALLVALPTVQQAPLTWSLAYGTQGVEGPGNVACTTIEDEILNPPGTAFRFWEPSSLTCCISLYTDFNCAVESQYGVTTCGNLSGTAAEILVSLVVTGCQ
jgi:hypothetical protein